MWLLLRTRHFITYVANIQSMKVSLLLSKDEHVYRRTQSVLLIPRSGECGLWSPCHELKMFKQQINYLHITRTHTHVHTRTIFLLNLCPIKGIMSNVISLEFFIMSWGKIISLVLQRTRKCFVRHTCCYVRITGYWNWTPLNLII